LKKSCGISATVTTFNGYESRPSTIASAFTVGSLQHYVATQGTIGATSAVTSQFGFLAGSSMTGATNNYGFYGDIASGTNRYNLYMSGTASNYMAGALGIGAVPTAGRTLQLSKTITGSTLGLGIHSNGAVQSDVTNEARYFNTFVSTAASAFTLPSLTHYYASQSTIGATSTVTNQFGFHADTSLTGATNNYGFYGNIASGTGRYNLYMVGTADNYMAGSLGIGATPSAGRTLTISKNITGSVNCRGVFNNGIVQSDATDQAFYYATVSQTAATAFTLANLTHYYANQGTIGAGSTVTSQSGFVAESTLTGATNNYGFLSNIASGTGRWNFYANGTAQNYMAGTLGIGTTSPDASALLDVQSTTKGVRMPNMTTTQKNAISSPAAGLMVFDTTLAKLCVYSGSAWQTITSV
jgi:hypothetical protein